MSYEVARATLEPLIEDARKMLKRQERKEVVVVLMLHLLNWEHGDRETLAGGLALAVVALASTEDSGV